MRFSLAQVVVMWAVIGGTMVMVFLFGLYAGREQGVRSALEDRNDGTDTVRLPVAGSLAQAPVPGGGNPSGAADVVPPTGGHSVAADSAAAPARLEPEAVVAKPPVQPENPPVDPVAETALPAAESHPAPAREPLPAKGAAPAVPHAEPQPAKASAAQTTLTHGWYLQIGATKTKNEALDMMKKLEHAHITPKLEEARVGDTTYYRIVLGPYGQKEQALAQRAKVTASGAIKGEPFLKSVQ